MPQNWKRIQAQDSMSWNANNVAPLELWLQLKLVIRQSEEVKERRPDDQLDGESVIMLMD